MSRLWAMDSVSIRIPLTAVKIIDSELQVLYHTFNGSTGEEKAVVRTTNVVKLDSGIKTKFSIEIQFNKDNQKVEHLVVMLTSKMLKSRYFEGIHSGTIQVVFDFLMDQNSVVFSMEEFMSAQCVDIDFKHDFTASKLTMKQALKVMEGQYIKTGRKHSFCEGHGLTNRQSAKSETNIGLQFNDRKTTSIHTSPYMKIYFKTGELLTKSNIFALSHLNELPEDLIRVEFTIKNKEHLKISNMPNTLEGLLNTPQEVINEAYEKTLRVLVSKRLREAVKNDQIAPKDLAVVNLIIQVLDAGGTWAVCKTNTLGTLTGSNRVKKSAMLEDLYNSYIAPIKKYSNFKNVDTVLEQIGYTY
jgi:hypothetical protein